MIALVVLNYNDAKTTKEFVSAICDYSSLGCVIIVDNASTDGSYEELQAFSMDRNRHCKTSDGDRQHIYVLRTAENGGYASGNNFGAKYAIEVCGADYIIFSNPDVEFSEDIIGPMLEVFSTQHRAGLVTCRMEQPSTRKAIPAWKLPTYLDCLFESFIVTQIFFNRSIEYKPDYFNGKLLEVDAVQGSFFMLRADSYCEVGGFDEGTFLYYEENILGHRMKSAGYKEFLINEMSYLHRHSTSISRSIPQAEQRFFQQHLSRKYYCRTYLNSSRIALFLMDIVYVIGINSFKLGERLFKGQRS